jgi:hypothetical protein
VGVSQTDFGGLAGDPNGSKPGVFTGTAAQADSTIHKRRRIILNISGTYRLSTPINYIIIVATRNGKINDNNPRQILHGQLCDNDCCYYP